MQKAYFDQQMRCKAPTHWSKYATTDHVILNLAMKSLTLTSFFHFRKITKIAIYFILNYNGYQTRMFLMICPLHPSIELIDGYTSLFWDNIIVKNFEISQKYLMFMSKGQITFKRRKRGKKDGKKSENKKACVRAV